MTISILLFALVGVSIPHESELKQTVSAYWSLMVKGEKAAALKYVLGQSQNEFVSRIEPKVRNWQYVSAESTGPKEATVTVEIEALFRGAPPTVGFQKLQKRETWVWEGKAWKLKVEKPSADVLAPLVTGRREEAELPKTLQLSPMVVKIQFLNTVQKGQLKILNGTDLPVELISARVDETRFQIVRRPDRIATRQTADLVLEYKGTENDKNLQSMITVVLKQGDEEKLFQVPILYNYLSAGARGLFGLTEEQARQLKRGDKVTPAPNFPAPTNVPKLPNQP